MYDGSWKNGKKEGKGKDSVKVGIMYYENGEIYNGEWKDNKRNGRG